MTKSIKAVATIILSAIGSSNSPNLDSSPNILANIPSRKSVNEAMDFLTFHKQKASAVIKKLLESAIANAENNDKADIDLLIVKSVIVNQGMRLKRMKPRARGRADRIIKPSCHIEIILSDQEK